MPDTCEIRVVAREYRHGCEVHVIAIDYGNEIDHEAIIWGPENEVIWAGQYESNDWQFALNEAFEWLRWNSPHEFRYEAQYWLTAPALSLFEAQRADKAQEA